MAVLDASALLALLNEEAGADEVAEALDDAMMSAVNHSEVVAKLSEAGMPETIIRELLGDLGLVIVSFDVEQSYAAGVLRLTTKSSGLSLGDRACLRLAQRLALPVLTTDQAWTGLDLGIEVRLAR